MLILHFGYEEALDFNFFVPSAQWLGEEKSKNIQFDIVSVIISLLSVKRFGASAYLVFMPSRVDRN